MTKIKNHAFRHLITVMPIIFKKLPFWRKILIPRQPPPLPIPGWMFSDDKNRETSKSAPFKHPLFLLYQSKTRWHFECLLENGLNKIKRIILSKKQNVLPFKTIWTSHNNKWRHVIRGKYVTN